MKDRICNKCTFYLKDEPGGWYNKCLMITQNGWVFMKEHLKIKVLPFNKCDYFKEGYGIKDDNKLN